MLCQNKGWWVQGNIADFDANSLYPSAMVRLGIELGGVLKGKPKVIEIFEPEKYDGYFVCVRVTKIGKYRNENES